MLSAVSQPPNFPPVWSGIPTANYTMVGYDAGTLNVAFSSDCSAGPGSQKISTVYPDRYTVTCNRRAVADLGQHLGAPHTPIDASELCSMYCDMCEL